MAPTDDMLMELVQAEVERIYGEPRLCVLVVPKVTAPSTVRRPVGSDGVDVHSNFPLEEMTREALEAAIETLDDPGAIRRQFARTVS